MSFRLIFGIFAVSLAWAANNAQIAARLAKEARHAQNEGQLVKAYLLYAEAAVRDPKNATYAVNREAIAPMARLLTKANVQNADISADIRAAESAAPEPADSTPPIGEISASELEQRMDVLQPPPHVQFDSGLHDFDLRLGDRAAIRQIAQLYGVQTVFDPDFEDKPPQRFTMDRVDFPTAMEAITSVTGTFVFPVSSHSIFVARDTEVKRNEFEPNVVVTVQAPETVNPTEVLEAATAIRGALALKAVSWDSLSRTLVIRDRVTRARVAQSLIEAMILPKAQLSFEVQIVAIDDDVKYHYGVSLPTSFPEFTYAHLGALQSTLPNLNNVGGLAVYAARGNFFGLALGSATAFASYNKSNSKVLFNATVVVGDGQTASLHVGDKYPIPTSLYSGFQQSGGSIYNPVSQVTLEDLGLVLKIGARVNGGGDISVDLEAQFKTLGTESFNTVPAVAQREFKGSVRIREDQYAVIAGMDSDTHSTSRNGIAGLSEIPGLDEVLSENTRNHTISKTMVVIKPTIIRLPMSSAISPQYLLGPQRGTRVLL